MQSDIFMLHTEEASCTQSTETSNENAASAVEALRKEVVQGFLDSHIRSNKNVDKALEIASFSYALIELLQEKGLITFEELNERKRTVIKRLAEKFVEQGIGVIAMQDFTDDKYTFNEEVTIDCASRLHICRAACCRLELALSKQDIEEGIVKWDLGRPYMIAREADGYCRHCDRTTYRCGVWQQRPIPCRGYDCRKDERIWLDFEQGIINPNLENVLSQRDEMTT